MTEKSRNTRYFAELSGALLLYVLVLVVSLRLVPDANPGAVRIALAVMPALPLMLMIWVIARHFRRIDEYLQRVSLESIAIAAAVVAGLSLTYGFLENAGFPRLSMFVVWPLMGATWGVLALVRGLRER